MHSKFTDPRDVQTSEPMEHTEQDASPGGNALEHTIQEFLGRGQKAGNYRAGLERVLSGAGDETTAATQPFRTFVEDRGTKQATEINKRDLAAYAEHLADAVTDAEDRSTTTDGISAATAWTYYDFVSAYLSYLVEWGYLEENPARKGLATNQLPPRPNQKTDEADFWTSEDRRALLRFADRRAEQALDEHGTDAIEALRDRALIYVLAYTGVRGGEVLADPRDDRRDGLRWEDVALEGGHLWVLGKNQTEEQVQLPRQTHGPLERLQRALDPPDDRWPVFPTLHRPTLSRGLPDNAERDEDQTYLDCYREADWTPNALTTNGGRSVLKRLCEAADLDVDGGYLKPHGARRGVGEMMYRERGAAAAQRTLRHADPRTTSEMYAHIKAEELAEEVGDVFDSDHTEPTERGSDDHDAVDVPDSYQQ